MAKDMYNKLLNAFGVMDKWGDKVLVLSYVSDTNVAVIINEEGKKRVCALNGLRCSEEQLYQCVVATSKYERQKMNARLKKALTADQNTQEVNTNARNRQSVPLPDYGSFDGRGVFTAPGTYYYEVHVTNSTTDSTTTGDQQVG